MIPPSRASPLAYRMSKARLIAAAAITSNVAPATHMSKILDEVLVKIGELCT
jgi:hypothetical protein